MESHADDGDAEEAVTKIQQQNREVMDALELVRKPKVDYEARIEWETEYEVSQMVQEEIVEYPQIVSVTEDRRLAFDGSDDDDVITIGGRIFM